MKNKVILVDCDGVLCDWEYVFNSWMKRRGYNITDKGSYYIDRRYDDLTMNEGIKLIKHFNESVNIGNIPPLRDSIHYVKKLHQKYGFVFHVISSFGLNPLAHELRTKTLQRIFGKSTFEKFIYLGLQEDKIEVLKAYKNTGCFWIEDKMSNAINGYDLGLKSILLSHEYNKNDNDENIIKLKNWNEIYNYIKKYNS